MPAAPKKDTPSQKPKAASPANLKINFLRGDSSNLITQIVTWITYLGLPILYVVAAAVFGCAGYKYYLDQQLVTLGENIAVAASTTKTYLPLEKELNAITSKYADVEDFWLAEKIVLLLPKLTLVVPPEVQLNELAITPTNVRFSGFATDKAAITTLVNNIQAIQNTDFPEGQKVEFYNIRYEDISTTTIINAGFSFSVRFDYTIKDATGSS